MAPGEAFSFTVGATAVALLLEILSSRRRRRILRRLAGEWRMTYSRSDSLVLTPKVAARFPIPGAADLRVTDVIYGTEHDRYRYVFLAEFTTGTVRTRRRQRRVATFTEPRDRQQRPQSAAPVTLAPEGGTILEQFRKLAPVAARPKTVIEPVAPASVATASVPAAPGKPVEAKAQEK
jgi:hypothetical protein